MLISDFNKSHGGKQQSNMIGRRAGREKATLKSQVFGEVLWEGGCCIRFEGRDGNSCVKRQGGHSMQWEEENQIFQKKKKCIPMFSRCRTGGLCDWHAVIRLLGRQSLL